MDAIIQLMENRLEQHNKDNMVSAPIKLVISLNVAYHVLHISHALNRQRGHVILIGDAGRGRRSCATVAALLLDYEIFQVTQTILIYQIFY
jgi:dynein heavy chain